MILRVHVPRLETVNVGRCLSLYQRWLSFQSRRHEERRLARAVFRVGFRQTFEPGRRLVVVAVAPGGQNLEELRGDGSTKRVVFYERGVTYVEP